MEPTLFIIELDSREVRLILEALEDRGHDGLRDRFLGDLFEVMKEEEDEERWNAT